MLSGNGAKRMNFRCSISRFGNSKRGLANGKCPQQVSARTRPSQIFCLLLRPASVNLMDDE